MPGYQPQPISRSPFPGSTGTPAEPDLSSDDQASDPSQAGSTGSATPPSLRREILYRLRQAGPSSPDQLAAQLGASRTGVLQQLRALESAALVTRHTVRHGVGRPRHLYDVTADAQDLFPANYDGLAAGLLAAVRELGGEELIDELFEARRRQIGDRIRSRLAERLPPDASIADRVRELAVIQDEQGYLAEARLDANGTLRLVEYNCAIYHVAKGSAAACRAELDLFSDVLGVPLARESHIAAGDRCCMYRVIAPGAASPERASDRAASGARSNVEPATSPDNQLSPTEVGGGALRAAPEAKSAGRSRTHPPEV